MAALAGAINRLEKAFPEQWHFLMEFIQNADDSQSNSFSLRLTEDAVTILNDGREFDYDDVESVCNVGQSSKANPDKGEDYIGYLGVGFKSVFLISDNPRIYSGEYQFEFDKHSWSDPTQSPWQIIPIWIHDDAQTFPDEYNTKFEIPFSDDISQETFDKLTSELDVGQISDRTILFLKNLEEIEIIDEVNGVEKTISKSIVTTRDEYDIVEVTTERNDETETTRWLRFTDTVEVPGRVKEDRMTKQWERHTINHREIIVAFELNTDNVLQKQEGTAHIGVFSFLPLKEVPSGLNFLVQADFLTAPGRETIHRDALWNRWLAQEIFELIIGQAIPAFKQDSDWRKNFTTVLYPQKGGHSLFDDEIHRPLQDHLKDAPVLLTVNDEFGRPCRCVNIDSSIGELISDNEFDKLYPNKSRLHPDCEVAAALEQEMTSGPTYSPNRGLSDSMNRLFELKAQEGDTDFFSQLYREIGEWTENTLLGTKLRREEITLTEADELEIPRNVRVLDDDLELSSDIRDDITILHPRIADETAIETLELLGAKTFDQADIDKRLRGKDTIKSLEQGGGGGVSEQAKTTDSSSGEEPIEFEPEWSDLSEERKIEQTIEILDLFHEGVVTVPDLGDIKVKSKDGEWVSPEDILYPAEYYPNHRIEALHTAGLIPTRTLFLSTEYLEERADVHQWKQFFDAIGVESNLNEISIVEQVAIESALLVEAEEGRDAKALSRHEEIEGYDIQSESRVIEVKGSKKESPSVNLTQKQFGRLKDNSDNYYLYIVRDALQNPSVSIIKGKNILNVKLSVKIDYSELQNLTDSEHSVL
ncbi:DUF3883 domain-containing protein [Halalkalicoccus tibetensis]|uniref:DUF3883 domain-containing protein n=1 Tax=Halalkalicoccus tibetensis TaxID=175632 RepID=A0ABD5V618_9EURY